MTAPPRGEHYEDAMLIRRATEQYYNSSNADRDPTQPGSVQRGRVDPQPDGRLVVELATRNAPGQPEQVVAYEVVDHEPDLVNMHRDRADAGSAPGEDKPAPGKRPYGNDRKARRAAHLAESVIVPGVGKVARAEVDAQADK